MTTRAHTTCTAPNSTTALALLPPLLVSVLPGVATAVCDALAGNVDLCEGSRVRARTCLSYAFMLFDLITDDALADISLATRRAPPLLPLSLSMSVVTGTARDDDDIGACTSTCASSAAVPV
jgi:hypothetical protein